MKTLKRWLYNFGMRLWPKASYKWWRVVVDARRRADDDRTVEIIRKVYQPTRADVLNDLHSSGVYIDGERAAVWAVREMKEGAPPADPLAYTKK